MWRLRLLIAVIAFLTYICGIRSLVEAEAEPTPVASDRGAGHSAEKPFFIVHIGPPKTATTYIQEELNTWSDILRRVDNVTFAGKFLQPGQGVEVLGAIPNALRDRNCQRRALRWLLEEEKEAGVGRRTTWTTSRPDKVPQCWTQFLLGLEDYRASGQSILVSDEVFTFDKFRIRWELLQRDLSDDFHLIAIVAYRRLSEWLPSSKQQGNRWTPSKPKLNFWPGQGGRECENTMDWIRSTLRGGRGTSPHSHTSQALETIPDFVDTRVLDIHHVGNSSVRTALFCDVLRGITPNVCERSRQHDLTERQSKSNPKQSEFYDKLATSAGSAGLLGDVSRFNRRKVALAIQHQQESVLNKTSNDFPLDCPDREELQDLLNASLKVELDLANRGYINPQSDDHEQQFWEHSRQYCWINSSAVLAMEEWKAFFRSLSPG